MLNIANPGTVAVFQTAIQDDYPVVTPLTQLGVSFSVQAGQVAGMQSQTPTVLWRFADANDDWNIVLSQEFVSLETRSYESFEDFQARLQRVLDALVETVRPKHYTRIGLRYINELRPGHQEWSTVVRKELLGPMTVSGLSKQALRWSQQILLEGPEGEKLHIQQGIVPEGTTVERRPGDEEAAQEPVYLLDMDAYLEFARPLPEMSVAKIIEQVNVAHETTSEFFRWAITKSYATSLGVRGNTNG